MARAAANELVTSDADIARELANTSEDEGAVDDEQPAASNPELEVDEEIPTTWTDDDQEEDEDTTDSDEATEDTPATGKNKPQSQTVRKFKANGQEHDVDMKDQARVDQLITLGLGARPVFSERDTLRKQVSAKDKQIAGLQEYKATWDKLEAAKSHSREALYEKVFGEKWDDAITRAVEERNAYASATPEERRLMDYERRVTAAEKAAAERERQWEARQKEVDTKTQQAEVKELKSMLMPEFNRHEFSERVKDPAKAEALNAILWRQTIASLKKQYGENVAELTPEQIRREFKKVSDLLAGAATDPKAEVKAITDKKKTDAKTQAQAASTRAYSKPTSDTKTLAKEKDPVKLFKKMFG